jgi:hypothetical protein
MLLFIVVKTLMMMMMMIMKQTNKHEQTDIYDVTNWTFSLSFILCLTVTTRLKPRSLEETKAMAELQCHSVKTRERHYMAMATRKRKLAMGALMMGQMFMEDGASDEETDTDDNNDDNDDGDDDDDDDDDDDNNDGNGDDDSDDDDDDE